LSSAAGDEADELLRNIFPLLWQRCGKPLELLPGYGEQPRKIPKSNHAGEQ